MRLALIINIWDDWGLLTHSLRTLRPLVDEVIIVASTKSNFGEYSPIPECWKDSELYIREPQFSNARDSETDKRNYGLKIARERGCTHFLTADSDELYDPKEFLKAKELFKNTNLKGLVCPVRVYFKSPTLCLGLDITLVPFIHELTPTIKHEFNKRYPYAWSGPQIRIDPTRSLNINDGVKFTEDVVMEHFSWVRPDYEKKIRNSTARANLERSTIRQDLENAKPGYFVQFYQKTLYECENKFNIRLNHDMA